MRQLIATFVLLAALALAPAASADLPKNSDRTIVPGESIGGVKVGMTGSAADKLWKGEGCGTNDADGVFCAYEPKDSGANFIFGYVAFSIDRFPKIASVSLSAAIIPSTPGDPANEPTFPAGLRKYKMGEKFGNIGLKAPLSKVKQVFGSKLKKDDGDIYTLKGQGKGATTFSFLTVGGKLVLARIVISKG